MRKTNSIISSSHEQATVAPKIDGWDGKEGKGGRAESKMVKGSKGRLITQYNLAVKYRVPNGANERPTPLNELPLLLLNEHNLPFPVCCATLS